MKKCFRVACTLTALALALMLCLAAFAETVEPEAPDAPDAEDVAPAESAAPAEDAAPAPQNPADDSAALRDALNAYRAARQSRRQESLEAELKEFVDAGKLTQEQADLILKNFQDRSARGGKGKGGMRGRSGKGMRGGRGFGGKRGGRYGYSRNSSAASGTAYADVWSGAYEMGGLQEDI